MQEVTQALKDVIDERENQITVKGWTLEHDDQYSEYELLHASLCYIAENIPNLNCKNDIKWPWDDYYFKPTSKRKNLIKAAALIIAEIERLDRLELNISKK